MPQRRRKKSWLLRLAVLLGVVAGGVFWLIRNPVIVPASPVDAPAAQGVRLEADVRYLTGTAASRKAANTPALDAAARYIVNSFVAAGCGARQYPYRVDGADYTNVICSFGPADAPRLVIGAHYDVFTGPGADDNASGVAALLELARLMGAAKPALAHRLDLVAFTLEEPPHFRTPNMGSYVHARRLVDDGAALKLAISVEMVGYFSDDPGSQHYAASALGWLYPDRADFIGVVGRTFDRSAVKRVKGLMAAAEAVPVWSINAPVALAGIDFSDHWSFWQHGLPAVMVTDTAFLRNPNYHRPTDTADTLDYRRMAGVVDGLFQVAVGY
jgi:hypothetical protein